MPLMICSAVFTSTQKKNSIWNWFIDLFKSNSTTITAYKVTLCWI